MPKKNNPGCGGGGDCCEAACTWLHKDWGEPNCPAELDPEGRHKHYVSVDFAILLPSAFVFWTHSPYLESPMVRWTVYGLNALNSTHTCVRNTETCGWTQPEGTFAATYTMEKFEYATDGSECPILSPIYGVQEISGDMTVTWRAGQSDGEVTTASNLIRSLNIGLEITSQDNGGTNLIGWSRDLDAKPNPATQYASGTQDLTISTNSNPTSASDGTTCPIVGSEESTQPAGTMTNTEAALPGGIDTSSPQEPKLELVGGAWYNDILKRIVLPSSGAAMQSVTQHPTVLHGMVAFKVTYPPAMPEAEYADPYGYQSISAEIGFRVYFESDEARENYVFADYQMENEGLRKDNGEKKDLPHWKVRLGRRTAGVDTFYHQTWIRIQFDGDGAGDALHEDWVVLVREGCHQVLVAGCREVYQTYHTAEDSSVTLGDGTTGRAPGDIFAVDGINGVGWPHYENAPAGRHFGIFRRGSGGHDESIQIGVAFAGHTVQDDISCPRTARMKIQPCTELLPVSWATMVNGSFPGTTSDSQLTAAGGNGSPIPENYGNQTFITSYWVSKEEWTHGSWGAVVTTWIPSQLVEMSIKDQADDLPSEGESPAKVVIRQVVTESTWTADGSTQISNYTVDWTTEIDVEGHALDCASLDLLLAPADAAVTKNNGNQPLRLTSFRITGSAR